MSIDDAANSHEYGPGEDEHPITHEELRDEGLEIEQEEEEAMDKHHPTPDRPSGRKEP